MLQACCFDEIINPLQPDAELGRDGDALHSIIGVAIASSQQRQKHFLQRQQHAPAWTPVSSAH